ncbi:MAG: polysaccharide deacetylase family protein [Acutalibacteraceae bacterium]|nr:polysaccharide deacetylase family protein [Acutalibacteraceae bacterium]
MKFFKSDNFHTIVVVFISIVIFTAVFLLVPPSAQSDEFIQTVFPNLSDDKVAPEITLNGKNFIILEYGEAFEDEGCTATDDVDGDLTDEVTLDEYPDTYIPGTKVLTYTVSDSAGNTATATRVLLVKHQPEGTNEGSRTVYLTFDDGPCVYTPQILDILKQYNVKATFFVTAQKPEYAYLMKRIVDEGHTIAAHTYSHLYDIYSSSEAYFDDLDKINKLIYEQTGQLTAIVRFPGGSSNVISKKYKEGVMSELVPMVLEKGYTYFDWNVDSGDASTSKPDKIVRNVTGSLGDSNNIVLMHDMKSAELTALPQIIEYCYSSGYTFAPLTDGTHPARHSVNN